MGFWDWLFGRGDHAVRPRTPEDQAKVTKATRVAYENAAAAKNKGEGDFDGLLPRRSPGKDEMHELDVAFDDDEDILSEPRDDEADARELYALLDQPTAWESLTERQRTWWRNRGRHTRRHSYCWEAQVDGYWQWAGDLRAAGFNLDGHPLGDNPRGSEYHLAKNRQRAAYLDAQGHRPIKKTVIIFDTSDTPTGPEHPPRIVMQGGEYVSPATIAEPIGGMPAEVVTDRCHGDCLMCGVEGSEEAERWARMNATVSRADLDAIRTRLRYIEQEIGLSSDVQDELDAIGDDDNPYGLRILGDEHDA